MSKEGGERWESRREGIRWTVVANAVDVKHFQAQGRANAAQGRLDGDFRVRVWLSRYEEIFRRIERPRQK